MDKNQTNMPDWSALMPVLPGDGRGRELYAALARLRQTGALAAGAKLPTTRDLPGVSACRARQRSPVSKC